MRQYAPPIVLLMMPLRCCNVIHPKLISILFLFAVVSIIVTRTILAQDAQPSIGPKFGFLPTLTDCHPAEVRGFAFGKQATDVLLAHLIVRNRSVKTINALKVAWVVSALKDSTKVVTSICDTPLPADAILLSGSTELIEIGSLGPTENLNIVTHPQMLDDPSGRTIIIKDPIVTSRAMLPLTSDPIRKDEKYIVAVYISEIQFQDGTQWLAKRIES